MQDQINQIEENLEACKTEVGQQVEALRSEISGIKSDVGELLAIFNASKGFIKVLGWIGKTVKWVLSIGVALGLGYAATKK